MAPEVADRIKSLAQEQIDWACLVEMAYLNAVTPLLYRSLTGACADAVPGAILDSLAERCRTNTIRSLLLTAELLRLLDLFAEHGIQAVPFKGPVLAASAYGDVALREYCDLDILVRKRDLRRTRKLGVSQGYHAYRWNLEKPGSRLTVELHSYEFGACLLPGAGHRSQEKESLATVSLLGADVPTLGPEEGLLGLCTHGSKHCWDRLSWVCDIAQFLHSQPRINWHGVLALATRTGERRRLLWGLLLALDLLGAPVPREVSALGSGDGRLTRLVAEARRRILDPPSAPLGNIERWATHLRMMERPRDRLRFCLGLLHEGLRPNLTDRTVVPLPRWLHVLYYAIHPMRIALTYGPRAVKRLFRRAT